MVRETQITKTVAATLSTALRNDVVNGRRCGMMAHRSLKPDREVADLTVVAVALAQHRDPNTRVAVTRRSPQGIAALRTHECMPAFHAATSP